MAISVSRLKFKSKTCGLN
uniref:Uncharacterized protein n=1 Tax=Anguilla anguilla TaxID=7936 RepID=A0A0E9RAQ4_ANGAN